MVLFQVPGKCYVPEVGLVTSVWKGCKAPKMISSEVPIAACFAFRAMILDIDTSEDRFSLPVLLYTVNRFNIL